MIVTWPPGRVSVTRLSAPLSSKNTCRVFGPWGNTHGFADGSAGAPRAAITWSRVRPVRRSPTLPLVEPRPKVIVVMAMAIFASGFSSRTVRVSRVSSEGRISGVHGVWGFGVGGAGPGRRSRAAGKDTRTRRILGSFFTSAAAGLNTLFLIAPFPDLIRPLFRAAGDDAGVCFTVAGFSRH